MEKSGPSYLFNFSRWFTSLEPGNDTIKAECGVAAARLPWCWLGNSSVGSFGTVYPDRSHAIGLSAKPIEQICLSQESKELDAFLKYTIKRWVQRPQTRYSHIQASLVSTDVSELLRSSRLNYWARSQLRGAWIVIVQAPLLSFSIFLIQSKNWNSIFIS